jgi:hypothetical protein
MDAAALPQIAYCSPLSDSSESPFNEWEPPGCRSRRCRGKTWTCFGGFEHVERAREI